MPIYHFHSVDGSRDPDPDGVELENDTTAQHVAMQFAGEVLKSEPEQIWSNGQWRVEVTDDDNILLFTIITIAVDAPHPGNMRDAARN
jgi:hypothetical protein